MFNLLVNRRRLLADRARLGRWGEKRCEKFLKRKGYRSLTRNFHSKAGEIDLIMVDGDGTIVFVEVKTRADESFAETESVITPDKRMKIIKTARYFLSAHQIEDRPLRFDVVTIILGEKGREQIRHYERAFVG